LVKNFTKQTPAAAKQHTIGKRLLCRSFILSDQHQQKQQPVEST
jgi:hypothetical protein